LLLLLFKKNILFHNLLHGFALSVPYFLKKKETQNCGKIFYCPPGVVLPHYD